MVFLLDNFVAAESESAHVPEYAKFIPFRVLFRHPCFSFSDKNPHFWIDTNYFKKSKFWRRGSAGFPHR